MSDMQWLPPRVPNKTQHTYDARYFFFFLNHFTNVLKQSMLSFYVINIYLLGEKLAMYTCLLIFGF